MKLNIKRSTSLTGTVRVPSSKSHSIRSILFGLLAPGVSTITHLLESDDTRDALCIAQALGAKISQQDNKLMISSPGTPLHITETHTLNTGNSGITTHFIMPLLGLRQSHAPIILDCGAQMRTRPIHSLVKALRSLGLQIIYLKKQDQLPISVSGELMGGNAQVDGLTSQYISALLMALPCAKKDSQLTVHHLNERSYMDMTLQYLDQQKIHYTHQRSGNTDLLTIQGGQRYHNFETAVPGDFSSASYLIAAGVLFPGTIELDGLDMHDAQGDKRFISILKEMGADITLKDDRLLIRGGKSLQGITIDANDIPDLLPTLAVIGTQASGRTDIVNVPQARIKETDRIHSMTEGLRRLGAKVEEHSDGMTIYPSILQGAELNGYGDHRTVMALSLAGLLADQTTIIEGSEAINKTFPTFVETMRSLGANMEVHHE